MATVEDLTQATTTFQASLTDFAVKKAAANASDAAAREATQKAGRDLNTANSALLIVDNSFKALRDLYAEFQGEAPAPAAPASAA